ncbi:uncharacterized protein LOC106422526 isoform X2 [Brassica napus]|uniref:uncharacterized protein LOC106422526 isoform X2 n=1 Tax=Brassica napus TaxID=3708 RepID=UPI000BBE5821|nr:uncharacterized protein LOC106422526 isoform X2 [Brassica napus]
MEDLSPLPEADNGGVTVTESSTPIAESASSKTNIALQPKVSENSEDATTRDCSIQYQTSVSPLRDLSPLPEADTGGVTVIESSTPIAETASSKTNSALQPEDATTRACSIQYETSISLLGEDMSPPLPEADKDGGVIVTESSTPIAEAAFSKTNSGSQIEDIQKPDDESTKPVTLSAGTTLVNVLLMIFPVTMRLHQIQRWRMVTAVKMQRRISSRKQQPFFRKECSKHSRQQPDGMLLLSTMPPIK